MSNSLPSLNFWNSYKQNKWRYRRLIEFKIIFCNSKSLTKEEILLFFATVPRNPNVYIPFSSHIFMTKRISNLRRRVGIGLCIAAALGISTLTHDVKYNSFQENYASEILQSYIHEQRTLQLQREKTPVYELRERLQKLNLRRA